MHRRALSAQSSSILACRSFSCPRRWISRPAFKKKTPLPWSKEVNPDPANRVEALMETMLQRQAKGESQPGWQLRKIRGGKERRVAEAVRKAGSGPPTKAPEEMSPASIIADPSSNWDSEFQTKGVDLEVGTFVEIRKSWGCFHGIVIDTSMFRHQRQVFNVISSTGEVVMENGQAFYFTIPNIVSSDLAARCNIPEEESPEPTRAHQGARIAAVKRLQDMEKAVEIEVMRMSTKFLALYDQVKSPDPHSWGRITLMEAAKLLDPRPNIPSITLFAIHKLIMKNSLHFAVQSTQQRTLQTFEVRPQAIVDNFHSVVQLLREDQPSREAFEEKARKRIAATKKTRLSTYGQSATFTEQKETLPWTPKDLEIIKFIENSVMAWRPSQLDPFAPHVAVLMKKIVDIPDRVDDSIVHSTLVDIGVLPPWEDPWTNDPNVLKAQNSAVIRPGDVQLISAALKPPSETQQPPGKTNVALRPDEFYAVDPCAAIRHDFGKLPVYIIDDPSAEELDDGLSIERIPSEPKSVWIHVHVADPTSLMHPAHTFARRAQDIWETFYLVQRTISMLPHGLVSEKLSLESSSGSQNTLTFSFKLDEAGEIIDHKIRAGIIRNAIVLHYDDVDRTLGFVPPTPARPFGTGEPLPPTESATASTTDKLTKVQVDDLRQLMLARDRMVGRRLLGTAFYYSLANATISLNGDLPPRAAQGVPGVYTGYPTVDYRILHQRSLETGSRLLVAECMKAACRVASRFCTDQGIPIIRRGSLPPTFASPEAQVELLGARTPDGHVDYTFAVDKVVEPGRGYLGLSPTQHWALGIPDGEGYVRVTSPLRRYLDLLCHWQIKHALLGGSRSTLPFSEEALLQLCRDAMDVQQRHKVANKRNSMWWAVKHISRWVEDREKGRLTTEQLEHDPLQRLDAIPMRDGVTLDPLRREFLQQVYLPKLGIPAFCKVRSSEDHLPVQSVFPVKIEKISLGMFAALTVSPSS